MKPEEAKLAHERLKKEIYNELRWTLQFALSQHFLKGISIKGLFPQFEHLRNQQIEAFWSMVFLRIPIFIEQDSSFSLYKFTEIAHHARIISKSEADQIISELHEFKESPEMEKCFSLRDKVIAHSDNKKPEDGQIIISGPIRKLEAFYIRAGGIRLDETSLTKQMEDALSSQYELIKLGQDKILNNLLPPIK